MGTVEMIIEMGSVGIAYEDIKRKSVNLKELGKKIGGEILGKGFPMNWLEVREYLLSKNDKNPALKQIIENIHVGHSQKDVEEHQAALRHEISEDEKIREFRNWGA